MTGNHFLTFRCVGDEGHRKFICRRHRRGVDALDGGVVTDRNFVVPISGENQRDVAVFDAHEFVDAIDEDDAVLFGKCQCILNPGIARTDDDDGLAIVLIRIIELILHSRQIFAGHTELA